MNLIIKQITFQGLKGAVDERQHDLYYHTLVEGDNGQGKTTIGDVICYGLYGCNLLGGVKTDILLNRGSKDMMVTLDIDVDGGSHIITRQRKGNATSIYLDGQKVNQADLSQLLPTKEVFLTIFNPDYFLTLSEPDGRALISKFLKPIEQEDVLQSLSAHEWELLQSRHWRDINVYISELRDDIKQSEIDITKAVGAIESYKDDLKKLSPTNVTIEQYGLKQDEQRRQLAAMEAALNDIDDQIRALDQSKPSLMPIPKKDDLIKHIQTPDYVDTTALSDEVNNLKAQWRILNDQLGQWSALSDKSICPTCKQTIEPGYLDVAKRELLDQIADIRKQGAIKDTELQQVIERNNAMQAEYRQYMDEEERQAAAKIAEVEQENAKRMAEHESIYKADRDKLIAEHNRLKQEMSDYNTQSSQILLALKDDLNQQARIEQIQESIRNQEDNKACYLREKYYSEQVLSAAQNYVMRQVEMQYEQIKKHLDHTDIRLKKIVKTTGEVKDCFEVTYDDKMINQLSRSERIKAGVEISHLMRQLTGQNAPLFVDNAESITTPVVPQDGQCITCIVVKGQPLIIKEDDR